MPAKNPLEAQQVLLAALPTEGEIPYEELYQSLTSSGERLAIKQFHDLRRKGQVAARINEGGYLVVSRPVAEPEPEPEA